MKKRRVPIESLLQGLFDGPHATPKPATDGPIFLSIGNITEDGKLNLRDIRHIAEEDFSNWTKRVIPQGGDIVFTYEATLNRYAIIPDGFRGCLGRRLALLRPDTAKVNPRFLYFYFFGEDWRKTISKNILSGATVDRIPLTTFPTFEVDLPSREEQDRITEILSAYDDLIENNTRRVRILEEMAQMIYREWFVSFRFPGHEQVGFKESSLGRIPDTWATATLDALVEEIIDYRGKTPTKLGGGWSEHGVVALSALNVKQGRLENLEKARFVSEDLYRKWMKSELKSGDILMTSEAPLGETYFLSETRRYCLSQRVFSIRANPAQISPVLLYFFLSSRKGQEQIRARASGTTVLGIRQSDLRLISVVRPDSAIQRKAEAVLQPFLLEVDVLYRQIANLRQTRHLLLSKLISGEITVEHFESQAVGQTV